jgi:hypothetical protein
VGACGGFLSVLRNDLARAPAGGGAPAPRPAHPVASPKRMVPSQRSLLGKHSRGMRRYARVGEPGRPPLRGRVPNRFLTPIRRHCAPRPPPPPPSRPAAARTTAPCSSRRLRPFLYGVTVIKCRLPCMTEFLTSARPAPNWVVVFTFPGTSSVPLSIPPSDVSWDGQRLPPPRAPCAGVMRGPKGLLDRKSQSKSCLDGFCFLFFCKRAFLEMTKNEGLGRGVEEGVKSIRWFVVPKQNKNKSHLHTRRNAKQGCCALSCQYGKDSILPRG